MAGKRIERWDKKWREWLESLSPEERKTVVLFVTLVDARPDVTERDEMTARSSEPVSPDGGCR